jgi:phosphoribosylamine--glycine ligase
VIICQNSEEANEALENMLIKKVFGDAGNTVVVEEFLIGPEISIHAFSDGKNHKMFPTSQDHKKIGENDTGLNTGGMGTIAPLPFVTDELLKDIEEEIVAPTVDAMNKDGNPFLGVIYPGLMLTSDGPRILEYNARFGDPETQSYMRLLDTDILDIFNACIDGKLDQTEISWSKKFACTIVLASGGYPENYEKGKVISGVNSPHPDPLLNKERGDDIVVFHAGTILKDNILLTNGGRVLGVSAIGDTLEEALQKAYKAIEKISFDGMQYRKDIGQYFIDKKTARGLAT